MYNVENIYKVRESHLKSLAARQSSSIKKVSTMRFCVFILFAVAAILFYEYDYIYLSMSCVVMFAIVFIFLVKVHGKFKYNLEFTKKLISINYKSIKRCNGEWINFENDGKEFLDKEHRYSFDLDAVGRGSVFQWINTCSTHFAQEELNNILTREKYHNSRENIMNRQEAVEELSKEINFRQRLECEADFAGDVQHDEIEKLLKLLNVPQKKVYTNRYIITLFKVIPPVIWIVIVLSFFLKMLPNYAGYSAILIAILILSFDFGNRAESLGILFMLKENISSYENIINMIYRKKFSSKLLNELLEIYNTKRCAKRKFIPMTELAKIARNIAERKNMMYILLNIFFLWDYQCMFSLEKWKTENGASVQEWISTAAKIEALCSLAVVNFDHRDWCLPKIMEKPLTVEAVSMAHPLIRGKAVHNDLYIGKGSKVLMITGSNMSGKSTFLRTAGVNLMLAYAGTRVFAEHFSCSIMKIYTCMRISDNLDENVSSFYGEILRIKSIVEAAGKGESIFFLLDEIFKGTNSFDRHLGAKILINELKDFNSCGMVSTHDLELCDMEDSGGSDIKNYHFKEYYENNKLHFDYKIRRGVSKTRNALYLMKMAGIDVPDNLKDKQGE